MKGWPDLQMIFSLLADFYSKDVDCSFSAETQHGVVSDVRALAEGEGDERPAFAKSDLICQ